MRSSCDADFENRLYGAATALVLDGAIDVVERIEADVTIERKPSLRVQVAQSGDEDVWNGVAFDESSNRLALQQHIGPRHVDRLLRAGSRSHQAQSSASGQTGQRRADQSGRARSIDDEVHAAR